MTPAGAGERGTDWRRRRVAADRLDGARLDLLCPLSRQPSRAQVLELDGRLSLHRLDLVARPEELLHFSVAIPGHARLLPCPTRHDVVVPRRVLEHQHLHLFTHLTPPLVTNAVQLLWLDSRCEARAIPTASFV